ncbi:MAG: sigma 54-interacting transcriptional regulator, partial [Porticoccus sp.]|nr:sigma 54-interacting transcriptional regulator [Porticoccus sp.]
MEKILIIEDEDAVRISLRKLLEYHGFEIREAGNIQKAQDTFELSDFSLVIAEDDTELIQLARPTPVLITSRSPNVKAAVEVMRKGAADYIPKSLNDDELISTVKRIINTPKSRNTLAATHNMIGSCEPMKQVFNIIHKVAMTDATVLIHGETGTGKELAANAIHNESKRAKLQLICVNCAAIPENLIEAELFGHEK